ncbi:deoxynucleoside triphosphate triphosphohydrolase SAMHD1-like isoform X2 [Acanthaster planci]|uniref:Deoxynucleoside triphosphate triphosphohydrolase SAMHD1 n=1 Tax=Acanthaster planci TaxID=133434 RepID=A0A8B7ZNZ7_ACAPL|nr:deoxynucleoside triphosphate triphosphohydrolase SAMHD1-like isoform X2 [Acanthaster planci]
MSSSRSKRKLSEGNLSSCNGCNSLDDKFDFADCENWTAEDVSKYLMAKGFTHEARLFQKEEISGKVLDKLTEELLQKKVGVRSLGKRLELLEEFQFLKKLQDNSRPKVFIDSLKVFNDPIHGHMEVHPLCVQIIDTPQFQRLRYIKQLGCSYLVFPGAAHNRFEHSLGVCHLAGTLCRTLQKRQPELSITENDVLCVQIAGLCHDLGHGPFSHMFDQLFIPAIRPDCGWTHEKASVDMFDHLIESNELNEVFVRYGLDDRDISFIKEQIAGPLEQKNTSWPYRGRPKDKSFLYEIVANKRNGIDVDKWDYFLRDCHNLGISSSFDCHRFMKFSRVIEVDGKKQICARDKEVGNLYDMFHTRNSLHRRAYQHKVNKIIESMLVEVLVKANDHWLIKGKNGKMLKMSEAIDDMVAFTQLTDDVILQIMRSDDPALAEPQRILNMVQRRQLYKCVGQTQPPDGTFIERNRVPKMKDEIVQVQETEDMDGPKLTPDQLIVHIVDLNYGMGHRNPIDYVRFYSKANPQQAVMVRKCQVSQMLPERFAEQHIRVYCKLRDPECISKAQRCFQIWCDKKKYTVQKAGNVLDPELTPAKPESQENPGTPEKKKSRTRLSM